MCAGAWVGSDGSAAGGGGAPGLRGSTGGFLPPPPPASPLLSATKYFCDYWLACSFPRPPKFLHVSEKTIPTHICSPALPYSSTMLLTPLQCPSKMLLYNAPLQFSSTMLLYNAPLQCSSSMLLYTDPLPYPLQCSVLPPTLAHYRED